jgi:hypothetical protein
MVFLMNAAFMIENEQGLISILHMYSINSLCQLGAQILKNRTYYGKVFECDEHRDRMSN